MSWRRNAEVAIFALSFVLGEVNAQSQATKKFQPAGPAARNIETSRSDAATGPDYRLGPEDVIEVFVWTKPDLTETVPVRPDGKVSVAPIGELVASGKTAMELQSEITSRLTQYLTTPIVNVIVKEVNSQKISVLGEVKKPDMYKFKQKLTALDAVALAGGFTEFAKKNHVIVIRNNGSAGEQRIKLDLDRALKTGGASPFYLQPFDTVYVE